MFGSRQMSVVVTALVISASAPASAQQQKPPVDNYDGLYERYLTEARAVKPDPDVQAWGWMTGLALDRRARSVNDLITIRVVESITGSGTADASLTKASDGTAGFPKVFGVEGKVPKPFDPTAALSTNSKTDFKGAGTTTRAGELTAQMTARVSEVLPNGDLVVEGVREIEINGDRQVVVLTGVVRVADIGPSNVVLSTSMGQLRIRYFGRGLMKDNLNPGWLIKILNKVF